MGAELNPCPFCGGEPEADYNRAYRMLSGGNLGSEVAIYCTGCSADMSLCREDHRNATPEELMFELIAAWNRRTAIALHDRVAELEGAIRAEIAARKSYERLPVDRGGSQGPKGQARAKWLKARKDLAKALERTTP